MKNGYRIIRPVAWTVAGVFTISLFGGLASGWDTSSSIYNVAGAVIIVGPATAVAKLCGRRLRKLEP
jgi:hypothetical protein